MRPPGSLPEGSVPEGACQTRVGAKRGSRPPAPASALSQGPTALALGRFARNLKGQLFSGFQNLSIVSGLEKQQNGLLLISVATAGSKRPGLPGHFRAAPPRGSAAPAAPNAAPHGPNLVRHGVSSGTRTPCPGANKPGAPTPDGGSVCSLPDSPWSCWGHTSPAGRGLPLPTPQTLMSLE